MQNAAKRLKGIQLCELVHLEELSPYYIYIYIQERIKGRGTFLASFSCVVTKYPDESTVRVKLLILVHKSTYSQAYKTGMSRQLNTGDQIASTVKKHSNKCLLGLAHFLHFLASRLSCQEKSPTLHPNASFPISYDHPDNPHRYGHRSILHVILDSGKMTVDPHHHRRLLNHLLMTSNDLYEMD